MVDMSGATAHDAPGPVSGEPAYTHASIEPLILGAQLFTLLPELHADLDGTLAAIARIGYRHVELAGFLGHNAADLRRAFDAAGLACRSAHIPDQQLMPDNGPTLAQTAEIIEAAHILGLEHIVMPVFMLPPSANEPREGEDLEAFLGRVVDALGIDDWKATADLLNERGEAFAKAGLQMVYHNHHAEFLPIDDTTGLDLLIERTDPDLVKFELDVGWAAAVGQDPAAVLARYPGRFALLHLKDMKLVAREGGDPQPHSAALGSADTDWRRIIAAARAAGVRDFYVEQEPPFAVPAIQELETSLRHIRALGL